MTGYAIFYIMCSNSRIPFIPYISSFYTTYLRHSLLYTCEIYSAAHDITLGLGKRYYLKISVYIRVNLQMLTSGTY